MTEVSSHPSPEGLLLRGCCGLCRLCEGTGEGPGSCCVAQTCFLSSGWWGRCHSSLPCGVLAKAGVISLVLGKALL